MTHMMSLYGNVVVRCLGSDRLRLDPLEGTVSDAQALSRV